MSTPWGRTCTDSDGLRQTLKVFVLPLQPHPLNCTWKARSVKQKWSCGLQTRPDVKFFHYPQRKQQPAHQCLSVALCTRVVSVKHYVIAFENTLLKIALVCMYMVLCEFDLFFSDLMASEHILQHNANGKIVPCMLYFSLLLQKYTNCSVE